MTKAKIIAIDGPAGSGKSTVAKEVAKRLGFLYVDTGAMYRALTLKAINKGLNLKDEKALIALSENMDIELKTLDGSLKVYLDKHDVTDEIRSMKVTTSVKHLASLSGVRINMVELQRRLSRKAASGAALEGRDIGTVVFPDALHKFYLDATVETRVGRRFDELKEKGVSVSREEIKDDVMTRDKTDMTRLAGPLKKAADAVVIDTTGMAVNEVVERIIKLVGN